MILLQFLAAIFGIIIALALIMIAGMMSMLWILDGAERRETEQ